MIYVTILSLSKHVMLNKFCMFETWLKLELGKMRKYQNMAFQKLLNKKSHSFYLPHIPGFETGTRPGVSWAGPSGLTRGDQEQWNFEKKEIIAKVVEIAVREMFSTHVYTFGGNYYKHISGGPIGLRTWGLHEVIKELI